MKVCVQGLWHLGTVTAACLAEAGFATVGLADDKAEAAALAGGKAPLFEPGLDDLLRAGLAGGGLRFTADAAAAVADADVVWVAYDTPVDDDDRADVGYVTSRIARLFPHLREGAVVLVSSQLPVGTLRTVEERFAAAGGGRRVAFACSPENLRLGKAIEVFRHPERVVVGLRDEAAKPVLAALFAPFCDTVLWMGVESAELSKHALNAFLATCVTFINEVATVAEQVGADAAEVERALRSEPRIGPNAYIRPGAAFAGGTLARDVAFLDAVAGRLGLHLDMIGSILASNRRHGGWPARRLRESWGDLKGRTVTVLGLAYKPGTDAVRRSLSVALVRDLCAAGARVRAFDPKVAELAEPPEGLVMAASALDALEGAEALVLMTEWPEFREIAPSEVLGRMRTPLVLDANGFLKDLAADARVVTLTIGKSL